MIPVEDSDYSVYKVAHEETYNIKHYLLQKEEY